MSSPLGEQTSSSENTKGSDSNSNSSEEDDGDNMSALLYKYLVSYLSHLTEVKGSPLTDEEMNVAIAEHHRKHAHIHAYIYRKGLAGICYTN